MNQYANYNTQKPITQRLYEVLQGAYFTLGPGMKFGTDPNDENLIEYKKQVAVQRQYIQNETYNPTCEQIIQGINKHLKDVQRQGYFSWLPKQKIYTDRVLIALGAFSDEHHGEPIRECFPVKESLNLLDDIQAYSKEKSRPITLSEQFYLAQNHTKGDILSTGLLLHSAFRSAARNRDTRVSDNLRIPFSTRLDIANSTALFSPEKSQQKDALGDTYHFWAQFVGGVLAKLSGNVLIRFSLTHLFYYVPNLMFFFRKILFKDKLLFGAHTKVDRMGFEVGRNMDIPVRDHSENPFYK